MSLQLGTAAQAPETLEGWYALHQVFTHDAGAHVSGGDARSESTQVLPSVAADADGWSAYARLIGSSHDVLALHLRPTLDEIGDVGRQTRCWANDQRLSLDFSFLSVTEAGLYHLTAQLAREAAQRGAEGAPTDPAEAAKQLVARASQERESPHVARRLYPAIPPDMPYVCFYPMTKRREAGQNWYTLTLDERSRLMLAHGQTGRRYAGRVLQIITGAIGFDAWEWGVTLFAKDPIDFKKLVTDMRFDEVSAKYAEFGEFFVGKLTPPAELLRT
jgi:hydrogen peroxide-dependent heme synthase